MRETSLSVSYNYVTANNDKLELEKVTRAIFSGIINKNILSSAYDLNGKLIAATKLYALFLGFRELAQILGKSHDDILSQNNGKAFTNQLKIIRVEAQTKGEAISYVAYLKLENKFHFLNSTIMPLCASDSRVIGTLITTSSYKSISLSDILAPKIGTSGKELVNLNKAPDAVRSLTKRQKEVLFLLIGGLTQEQIAKSLGISRSSVSNYLLSISYRFGLTNQTASVIRELGVQYGYDKYVPDNLINPQVLMVTHEYLLTNQKNF